MSKPDERVSDEVLQEFANLANQSISRKIARELLERRRGEYICPQCGLRQTPQQDSDGGIPW
jgi:hypothetical protein